MTDVTTRQREVFDFIVGFHAAKTYWPTVREIAEHFGFQGPHGADCHIQQLIRKGWLIRPKGTARAFKIPEQPK